MSRSLAPVLAPAVLAVCALLLGGHALRDTEGVSGGVSGGAAFNTWTGNVAFAATGAPLAADGPDGDTTQVDTYTQPATAIMPSSSIPAGVALEAAYLYWGGTQSQVGDDCQNQPDTVVSFQPPGGTAQNETSDAAMCSGGESTVYDIWMLRADVTDRIGTLAGSYTVTDYTGLINNGPTDNASFSVVLVYSATSLTHARIVIQEGPTQVQDGSMPLPISGLEVGTPAEGDLLWHVMDGDVGGTVSESVTVDGSPGAAGPITLQDAVNPLNNPMNHTINVTSPAQTTTLGVDLDRFNIGGALTPGDSSVNVTYTSGTDKWWVGYTVVRVTEVAPSATPTPTPSPTLGPPCPAETAAPGATCPPCPGFEPAGVGAHSTCPPPPSQSPTPTPSPTPTATPVGQTPSPTPSGQTPTPTPTPTPVGQTPSPTPTDTPAGQTPSPTPTATPVGQTPSPTFPPSASPCHGNDCLTLTPTPLALIQGNVDCRPPADSIDALQLLLFVAHLPTNQADGCPEIDTLLAAFALTWGDVNCDGVVNSVDALFILLFVAHLPYTLPAGCPDIGEALS